MANKGIARAWYIALLVAICASLMPLRATVYAYVPLATPATPGVVSAPSSLNASAPEMALPPSISVAKFSGQKIIVDNNPEALAQIKDAGGSEIENYGAFSLWSLDSAAPQLNTISQLNGVTLRNDFNTVYLRDTQIDTAQSKATVVADKIKSNLRQSKQTGAQLWLVQFAGPMREAWLNALKAEGVRFVIYMPNNAYVVWANDKQLAALEKMAQTGANRLQWTGAYHPQYRIDPALVSAKGIPQKNADANVTVTVQFYRHADVADSLKRLRALGGRVVMSEENVLDFINLTLEIPFVEVENIATWRDVFNIELWVAPKKNDEVQNQIIAGNVISTSGRVVPAAPGYLAWLGTKSFANNPARYPLVDVVDDGVDNGTSSPLHPDFYVSGSKNNPSRLVSVDNCTSAPSGNGEDGHGNINAGIVGSYNVQVGSPHVDAQGYNRGLGVNPFGRVASTKIFGPNFDLSKCANTYSGIVAKSYAKGAAISTNSWGANSFGGYTASSQAYDALQRDAAPNVPGNQELLHVFSAGNAGPSTGSVGAPATAKNVIAVAATENVRDEGIPDGCFSSASNNADDMSDFSSRGPTTDGRIKPDISAPGVHIQGPASQDPAYNGSGICGGATNFYPPSNRDPSHKYYPNPSQNTISQTLYTWSSGTSHSTPAVAGGLSLAYEYYSRTIRPGFYPSPAMAKALILNTPRYLNGLNTGGNLPSNSQGWGDLNMGAIFDGTTRYVSDQIKPLVATGEQFTRVGTVVSNAKPVHITLVWQDAPGSTTGNSYVNDLNLEVTVGGKTYKGNVFNGRLSVTGGAADAKNNVESVFLPAGVTGPISVRIVAANLAGDGVPGNETALDQDFALVVYNAVIQPQAVLSQNNLTVTGGDNDKFIEPGELLTVQAEVTNKGDAIASNVVGTLTSPTPGVTIVDGSSNFGNVSPDAIVPNSSDRYTIQLSPTFGCAGVLTLIHTVNYTSGAPQTITVTLPVGEPTTPTVTSYKAGDTPILIPDSFSTPPVVSTINVNAPGVVSKVTVQVNITHAWVTDLDIFLVAPNGKRVELSTDNGEDGDNYVGTIFDDDAPTGIGVGAPPFSGRFRPEGSLATVANQPQAGAWKLEIDDDAFPDVGTLNSWLISFYEPGPLRCANDSAIGTGYTVVASSDGDTAIEPSETVSIAFGVKNKGVSAISGVSGSLTSNTPGVTVLNGSTNFGNVTPNQVVTNTATPYRFSVDASLACSVPISFTHVIAFTDGASYTETISLNVGTEAIAAPVSRPAKDVPQPITSEKPVTVTSSLEVSEPGELHRLKVRIENLAHSFTGDLTLKLQSPDGTTVKLMERRGGSGDNFSGLVFSDAAPVAISAANAPFSGEFRPEEPLSAFRAQNISGTWLLIVEDGFEGDGGTLSAWSLDFTTGNYLCVTGPNEPVLLEVVSGNNQQAPLSTTFTNPLVVRVKNNANTPLSGIPVVFRAPFAGASGKFGGSNTFDLLAVSDANGFVTTTLFTANNIAGTYNVTAIAPGGQSANFTLGNGNGTCNALLVLSGTDDGTGTICSTLSYALVNVTAGGTITVTSDVMLSGPLSPTVPTGVKIVGGTGDCGGAKVVINGNGQTGNGLRLSGGNELTNLHVKGFAGRQITTLGTGNKLNCTKVSRT
jgi:subtilisin-like proprotein convertase family protein